MSAATIAVVRVVFIYFSQGRFLSTFMLCFWRFVARFNDACRFRCMSGCLPMYLTAVL